MDRPSPYQGLDAFGEDDVAFFFGRTRDIRLIVANVFASALTVLYGPSGVGKTSVLRAGVVPRLRERGRDVAVLPSWAGDAVGAVRSAVADLASSERPIVLVLDQFEDYFLDPTRDDALAAELTGLVARPGRSFSVLVSIREDAVAKLDRFEGRVPGLFDNVLRLDHLDRAAGREAILGPRDSWNERALPTERFEIEDGLVEEVLDSVPAGRGRIETALLQLVMRRLWDTKEGTGPFELRLQAFAELGGLAGIIDEHVSGTLDALSSDRQALAAAILEHLVTPSRLRIAQRAADLADWAGVGEDDLRPLLEELSGDRVLRPVAGMDGADSRYEVHHDSLADAVLGWRTRYVARREVEAERRRFRWKLAAVGLASLVLAALAALATYAWTQQQTARSEELSAEAVGLLALDPAAALEKALDAVDVRSISSAENALRMARASSHVRVVIDDSGGAAATSVDFGPGGQLLTADDGSSLVLRTAAGEAISDFPGIRSVTDAVFCPDAKRVAVAADDGAFVLARGRRVRLGSDAAGAQAIACSRNGSRIVTVTDEAVRVYSAAGNEIARIGGHESAPTDDAALSPDGKIVVTVGVDGARVVRISNGREVATLDGKLSSAAFSPDGARVVAGGADGEVFIWSFEGDGDPAVLRGHDQLVRDVAYSRDGRLVVSASTDRTARLWDARAGEEIAVLRGHGDIVESADFGPGRRVATASEDGTVRLWDVPVGSVLVGHSNDVTGVAITPDGERVATASRDGTVRVWEAESGRELARFRARTVTGLAIGADGQSVLTVHSNDGRARLWSVARPRAPVVLPSKSVAGAARAADGSLIATAGAAGAIAVFDPTGRPLRRFRAPADLEEIGPISFSREGDRLVVAEVPKGVVAVLDAATGAELARLAEPELRPLDVAFDVSGDLIVTAEFDGVARVWDARRGEPIPPALAGHDGAVLTGSFSPDSELVVTAGTDETVRLWHAATGAELQTLLGKTAAFAGDAATLVAAGPGPTARVVACRPCGSIAELRSPAPERRG